jgi:hypothetical protein
MYTVRVPTREDGDGDNEVRGDGTQVGEQVHRDVDNEIPE